MYTAKAGHFPQRAYDYKRWYMWLWQMAVWFHLPQLMRWHAIHVEHLFPDPLCPHFCFHVFTRLHITHRGRLISEDVSCKAINFSFYQCFGSVIENRKKNLTVVLHEKLSKYLILCNIQKLGAVPVWRLVPCEEFCLPSCCFIETPVVIADKQK